MLRPVSMLCCFLAGSLLTAPPTHAATPDQGCHLKPTTTASVTRIVDNHTVRLSDGATLRIDGVLAPTALDGLTATASWPPERKAL